MVATATNASATSVAPPPPERSGASTRARNVAIAASAMRASEEPVVNAIRIAASTPTKSRNSPVEHEHLDVVLGAHGRVEAGVGEPERAPHPLREVVVDAGAGGRGAERQPRAVEHDPLGRDRVEPVFGDPGADLVDGRTVLERRVAPARAARRPSARRGRAARARPAPRPRRSSIRPLRHRRSPSSEQRLTRPGVARPRGIEGGRGHARAGRSLPQQRGAVTVPPHRERHRTALRGRAPHVDRLPAP